MRRLSLNFMILFKSNFWLNLFVFSNIFKSNCKLRFISMDETLVNIYRWHLKPIKPQRKIGRIPTTQLSKITKSYQKPVFLAVRYQNRPESLWIMISKLYRAHPALKYLSRYLCLFFLFFTILNSVFLATFISKFL